MKTELETVIEMFTRTGLNFQIEKMAHGKGTCLTGYNHDASVHSMFLFDINGQLEEHRPYRAEDM